MTVKAAADPGPIPAKVSENMRPTVTAGLANDVELVNQYAAPMYAPTAGAASAPRPLRTSAKISATRNVVATTSATRCPGVTRSVVEIDVSTPNITLARTAPATAPTTWATAYHPTSPKVRPWPARRPRNQSASETTGLRWAPETGPTMRISTVSPSTVAVLFSRSCRPTSSGDSCCAAIPEPTTTATSSAVPRNSASRRRGRSGGPGVGMPPILTTDIGSVKLESMNTEQTSRLARRVRRHAALADPTRLRVVDLLELGDASSSELRDALGVPTNLLAHHLGVLEAAGLVVKHRSEGDGRRWYHCLDRDALGTIAGAYAGAGAVGTTRRVLFVCTANTARSHLAAALWRRASPVDAASAGTHPGDEINPGAVAAAARHGLTLPRVLPRLLADHRRDGDLVITVCDRAHEELGDSAWAHWSIPDPVEEGTDEAFDRAHHRLAARVASLAPRVVRGAP